MNRSIHLQPAELAKLIVQAASNAQAEGYWSGTGTAAEDAARHLVRYLGLLVGGDDDFSTEEMSLFAQIHGAAVGGDASADDLRHLVREAVEIADDPDAVQDFLCTTPPFLQAVMAMDRERGTRNAEQVVTALSGLALAALAADGRAEIEEDAVFTTHLEHLRRELSNGGLVATD